MWGPEPRIGIFVCHCGINIGVVKVPGLSWNMPEAQGRGICRRKSHTCSQDTQEKIKKAIQDHDLNRSLWPPVAENGEPLFQETIREVG
jgi:heterodisulfide reductase subunit A